MKSRRLARVATGFTLIELLVVISIIGILVGLLLPDTHDVRQAAAKAQADKRDFKGALCVPPICDALAKGTTIHAPAIPPSLGASAVLGGGLKVSYDPAGLADDSAFSLGGRAAGVPDTFLITYAFDPDLFKGDDFMLVGGDYAGGVLRLTVADGDGKDPVALAIVASSGHDIGVLAVPEPAGRTLLLLGLLGFAVLRARASPSRNPGPRRSASPRSPSRASA